jgi:hypothetical protein
MKVFFASEGDCNAKEEWSPVDCCVIYGPADVHHDAKRNVIDFRV